MQKQAILYSHKFLTIVSLLIILHLYACQKKDDISPHINISEPTTGHFSVLDTLQVKAKISDNEVLKSVHIYIIDSKNQKVSPNLNFELNQASYQLNQKYIIDNLYLKSGTYHLVVEASDGINISKSYVSIQIGALARQLEDILIVEQTLQSTEIYSIYSEKTLLKSFPFLYQDFAYNAFAQQYLFLSTEGDLIAYDKNELNKVWEENDFKSPSHRYFGSLFYKDNLIYVSHYLGGIKAYNEKGKVSKQANTIDIKGQISAFVFGYEKIMATKTPYVNGQDRIEELNEATGASVYTYTIQFTPEKLLFVDPDLCVIFGNQYDKAKACSLSTLYHVVHEFGDFSDRKINDAYQYNPNFYLLSIDHSIVEYNLSNGNERLIDETTSGIKFFHEDLYDNLYYVDQKKIKRSNFPGTGHQVYYQNDKTILDIIFIYNK